MCHAHSRYHAHSAQFIRSHAAIIGRTRQSLVARIKKRKSKADATRTADFTRTALSRAQRTDHQVAHANVYVAREKIYVARGKCLVARKEKRKSPYRTTRCQVRTRKCAASARTTIKIEENILK